MFPAAALWGASFPLALASVAQGRKDPARLVGGVYAANTLGAIAGAVGGSLLLTIWLGSEKSQQAMIIVSAISALLVLDAALSEAAAEKRRMQMAGTLLLAGAMAGAVLLARTVDGVPTFSSPTAATLPRASAKPTSSTWAKAGTPRSPSRGR